MLKNGVKLFLLIIFVSIFSTPAVKGDDLTLISHSGYTDLSGNYHVVGEIQNVGTSTYNLITVTVDFFDSGDDLIATRFDLTLLDVLLPARKSPFDVMLLDQSLSSSVDGYAISISQQTRSPLPKELRIVQHNWYTDELGEKHITGTVRNEAPNPAQDVKLIATFFDQSEDVSGAAFTYIDADANTLQAGESANFEIILDVSRSFYSKSYTITAESNSYSEIKTGEDPPPEPPEPEPDTDPELDPADIQVVSLSVGPTEIFTDSMINVNVSAENFGAQLGSKNIKLEIDSVEVDTKKVTLGPSEIITLNFVVPANYGVGVHEISVGEINQTITILHLNIIPPIITALQPINQEIDVPIDLTKLGFTVHDSDSILLNITITTIPYVGGLELINSINNTYSLPLERILDWNTTYTWTITAFDGKYESNASFKFTTLEESLPPIVSKTYPADQSTNITELLLSLKFNLHDPNNDRLKYFISINPGDYQTSRSALSKGEQSVLLPFLLVNNTEYKWWLNVTDQEYWVNQSNIFTTYFPGDGLPDPIPETKVKGDKLLLILLLVAITGLCGYLGLVIKRTYFK